MLIGDFKIDGYKIDLNTVLGEGTYGKVFACESLNPGEQQEQLCVKIISVIDTTIAQREEKIMQLLSEKAIFNPNIVKLKKVIYNDTQKLMIVVMERCQSDLLVEWKKRMVYSDEETYDILKQLLNGYKPLYENKIIHRDLKPQNILTSVINNKTLYKLSDFGIGKIYQRNDTHLSKTGTPVYCPPECNFLESTFDDIFHQDYQKLESKSPVDIYSLGIILYQLRFGSFPFQTDAVGIRNFIIQLKDQPFKITDCQGKDPKLIELIEKMIVFLPSKRITFNELFQMFFQETLTQRKIFAKTVQRSQPQPLPDQNLTKSTPQPPQRIASVVTQSNNQYPQQSQSRMMTIVKDFRNNYQDQTNSTYFYNQSSQIFQSQFQQPQNRSNFLKQTIQQPQNDFNIESVQKLFSELKELLSFQQNLSEVSNQALSYVLQKTLDKLNSNNLSKFEVQCALKPIRQYYSFKDQNNTCNTYIRFIFIFSYFAYGMQIQDLNGISESQMKSYLTQWYP